MAYLIAGLPDLLVLRATIAQSLSSLIGTYTFDGGYTDAAISVEGLGADNGEDSYPPTGTKVTGLEVVITPGEELPIIDILEGYIQRFRTTITLKQWDRGQNKTLKAFQLLQQHFNNIYGGSITRVLPSPQLKNIETLSFQFETNVVVEASGYFDGIPVPGSPGLSSITKTYDLSGTTSPTIGQKTLVSQARDSRLLLTIQNLSQVGTLTIYLGEVGSETLLGILQPGSPGDTIEIYTKKERISIASTVANSSYFAAEVR